jgi:hypothetical protein
VQVTEYMRLADCPIELIELVIRCAMARGMTVDVGDEL